MMIKYYCEVVPGGGVPHVTELDLTSLSVSCAICPDGLTSKLLVSSDFFPPLQLTKLTAATSRSKETEENSFEAMVRWGWLRMRRAMTFVPTCRYMHSQPWRCVCVSCPR